MVTFKDLTLREGSQVPGLEITEEMGLQIIDALAELDVECVEVSFPRAAARESWYRRADEVGLRTAALARSIPGDVDAALEVDPDEIEVIVNSSDVQLEYALGKTRTEARELLVENVARAIDGGADAGATLMDSIRADNEFLRTCARAAVDAGAKHITLADTTGAGDPETVRETVTAVADEIGGEAGIAVHTHDDLGVATANAVTGVRAGATSVDATIGGLGERAGNAPLEEVAVLLAEHGESPAFELEELVPVCHRVYETLEIDVPPGKPVIGERAYRHESGLHTAAMLQEPSTYEPFEPANYGGRRDLLFGRDTGRGAVRTLLEEVDVEPTAEETAALLETIQTAAEEKEAPLRADEARALAREHASSS